ncbi:MAG: zinc ribbon domain-containing protein [Firmicutes bacterium]|nr:zinc ribbon domain-containing protein [Bacillota bacterium]
MFCTNCGRKLRDDMKFCPDCGTKVENFELFPDKEAAPAVEAAEEAIAAVESAEEAAEPVGEAAAAIPAAAEEIAEAEEESAEAVEPLVEATEEAVVETVEEASEEVVEAVEDAAVIPEAVEEVPEAEEAAAEEAVEAVEEAVEPVVEAAEAAEESVVETVEETAGPAAEAVEEVPEPEVDAAEEVTPVATEAEAQPPKKKSKAPLIIVLALVVLAVAGYFIYQNLDSTKYGKLKKQIDAAMEQKDYTAAQPLIEEAFRYERDTEALQEYYRLCKLDPVLSMYDTVEPKEFIAAANEHIKEFPKSEEDLLPLIQDEYLKEAAAVLSGKDLGKIKDLRSWLAEAYETGKFPLLKDEIRQADEAIEHIQLEIMLILFSTELQSTLTPADGSNPADTGYIATFDLIRKELLSGSGKYRNMIMTEDKMKYYYPLILDPNEKGNSWAFYYTDNRYFLYMGGFKDGKREGTGAWICADNQLTSATWREYICVGNWSNDLPNGTFTEYRRTKYTNSDAIEVMISQANVKNGLYEGDVTMTLGSSKELKGTFKDGHPNVIQTFENENGEKRDVIFLSEDGIQYISIPSGTVQTRGIYGFVK